MNEISERFRAVIQCNTKEGRRWSELAALSQIPATSWQKAYTGKQRPTAEMIECIARLWPSYAFWLATGITDARHGHMSCRGGVIGAFYPEPDAIPPNSAKSYFEQAVLMFQRVYGTGLRLPDDEMRWEDQVRLLTVMLARAAEERNLSDAAHADLITELEESKAALRLAKKRRKEKLIGEIGST